MNISTGFEHRVFIRWYIIGAYTLAWAVTEAAVENRNMNQLDCSSISLPGTLFICFRYHTTDTISAPTSMYTHQFFEHTPTFSYDKLKNATTGFTTI